MRQRSFAYGGPREGLPVLTVLKSLPHPMGREKVGLAEIDQSSCAIESASSAIGAWARRDTPVAALHCGWATVSFDGKCR